MACTIFLGMVGEFADGFELMEPRENEFFFFAGAAFEFVFLGLEVDEAANDF